MFFCWGMQFERFLTASVISGSLGHAQNLWQISGCLALNTNKFLQSLRKIFIGKARTRHVCKNCQNAVIKVIGKALDTLHTPKNTSFVSQSIQFSSLLKTEKFKEDDTFASLHSSRDYFRKCTHIF